MTLSRETHSIKVQKGSSYRYWHFLDSSGKDLGSIHVNEALYKDTKETVKKVPAGHDIVGVQLTTDAQGYIVWMNFLLFPQDQVIF